MVSVLIRKQQVSTDVSGFVGLHWQLPSLFFYQESHLVCPLLHFFIHMDLLKLLKCVSTAHLLVLVLLVYSGALG